MDASRWKEIELLYHSALEAPDRASFLRAATGSDNALRMELESLLMQEPDDQTFERLNWEQVADLVPTDERVWLDAGAALGPYQIVERLGFGGAGEVFKALDTRLNRHVALKVVAPSSLAEEFRSHFVREARAAAGLNHPNIATIYEVGEIEGTCYISMEYIDGETLRHAIDAPSSTLRERLEYLLQVADGLVRAHAHGIVHCDLKPENVMVTRDGRVKILDFGLARLVEEYRREYSLGASGTSGAAASAQRTSFIEGTVGYMSPEQAAGSRFIDARSDIFSLGCMLFEAAAKRVPFAEESVLKSLESVRNKPAPPIIESAKDAPAGLQTILDGCLAKEPERRWRNVDQVAQHLRALLAAMENRARRDRQRKQGLAVAAVLAAAFIGYLQLHNPLPADSVAVIPFVTAQNAPEGAVLSEGISEGLIDTLARLPDLNVIARSSSFRFSGEGLDVPRVARTLGVRLIVTGRIAEVNGRLRVTPELVSGRDGTVIWSEEYNPRLDEVADVMAQIAVEIAKRVRSRPTEADQSRLARASRTPPEAYALYLRGRYQMRLYNPQSTQKAAEFFEQALGIDPAFALANVELANTYRRLGGAGILNPSEAIPLAERAVLRAIAAADDLADAHAVLADIKRDQWAWADAEREYRRAVELGSSLAAAHQGLAICLSVLGRDDEAMAEARRARTLDPLGLSGAIDTAAVFYNVRRYDQALEILRQATKIDATAPAIWTWIGIVSGGSRKFDEAISAFDNAIKFGDNTGATRSYYVHALARSGRRDQALRLLGTLQTEFVPPSALAIAYVGLNEGERAIDLLQQALDARDPLLQYMVVESHFDALRGDPRFQEIRLKMGLPR
jgi:eukaryotic-like serine/threonine-protein kinase